MKLTAPHSCSNLNGWAPPEGLNCLCYNYSCHTLLSACLSISGCAADRPKYAHPPNVPHLHPWKVGIFSNGIIGRWRCRIMSFSFPWSWLAVYSKICEWTPIASPPPMASRRARKYVQKNIHTPTVDGILVLLSTFSRLSKNLNVWQFISTMSLIFLACCLSSPPWMVAPPFLR
jgi:hypothetical protein